MLGVTQTILFVELGSKVYDKVSWDIDLINILETSSASLRDFNRNNGKDLQSTNMEGMCSE